MPSEYPTVVLRFTNITTFNMQHFCGIEHITKNTDGSLTATVSNAPDQQIIDLVLCSGGTVQIISPYDLIKKVIKQAENVINANMPQAPIRKIIKNGSYKNLLSYKKSKIIYYATVLFTKRFLYRGDRTVDQMIQAARSGKQNIVEGAKASGVSTETELRLTGVARASLEELLEDYIDYLYINSLPQWDKDDKAASKIRQLGKSKNETYEFYRQYFEERSSGTFANIMICLIHQCNYLLDRQISSLETNFLKNGGIKERMYNARIDEKRKNKQAE